MSVPEPDKTYLYAGQSYPPGKHDLLPDEATAALAAQRAEAERRESRQRAVAAVAPKAVDALAELVGDEQVATTLRAGGYGDVGAIRAASDADILELQGIGNATLIKIRAATQAEGQ